jgi:MoxR-like ATPase
MNAPERIAAQAGFLPDLRIEDALARHWVRVAMLHLRREVCWRWHVAQKQRAADSALSLTLDLARNAAAKAEFFRDDAAAAWLTDELSAPPPHEPGPRRGSFAWVAREFELDAAGAFVLGLGLLASLDHGAGPVIAECTSRRASYPTLALAQMLWNRPAELVELADPGHALWRRGILQAGGAEPAGAIDWESAFAVPPVIARLLAFPDSPPPALLAPLEPASAPAHPALLADAARLRAALKEPALRVVPVAGAYGADFAGTVAALSALAGRGACRLHVGAALRASPGKLRTLLAAAWFRDVHVLLADDAPRAHGGDASPPHAYLNDARDLPVTVFVPTDESGSVGGVAEDLRHPAIQIPRLTHGERVAMWQRELRPEDGISAGVVAECARRFRFEPATIRAAAAWLHDTPARGEGALAEACRAAAPLEVAGLAERVQPRFSADELVLAAPLRRQFDEIARAMQALGEVHHRWGTGRAWNESGISILLCGAPGCGKGMFAECLADFLDLPLYRIDLSQVVNKYIGETEKNLKRLFDAADVADAILFFDEADAIFGKRIEVRDAHDRYANLEVSYLLARMERFKGLAILATNRRRDLDEAFLRRLRAVVELPLPEGPQRAEIWRKTVPPGVDGSALDFDFLGRQFNLTGGHIRSAMLNACLQSAAGQRGVERPKIAMESVIAAIKRELDKLKRSSTPAQFGAYAAVARELDRD